MKQLYDMVGISRQSHYNEHQRRQHLADEFLLLSAVLITEREKHPSMSLKKLYHRLKPDFIGRDAFVDFGMENGFEPILNAKKPKLTRSANLRSYPNLLHDLKIFDINQVWASDITYFKVHGKWYYIVLIEDLYSRRILGHSASPNMFVQANIHALEQAIQNRKCTNFANRLIHHSDRGVQYRSPQYINPLVQYQIQISMGYSCFDNAFMERTNGVIKNEYLIHRNINSQIELAKHLDKDVKLYNSERPHGSLNFMTPVEFEGYIANIPFNQRSPLSIYTDKSKKNNLLIIKPDSQQLKFQFPKF